MAGVCLAIMSSGTVTVETAQAVTQAQTEKVVDWIFYKRHGPYLDDGRNDLVHDFSAPIFKDCDRLLMVDSDIEFTPDDIRQLVEDDLPIVAGVYHSSYEGVILPVVYSWVAIPGKSARTLGPITRWPDCDLDEDYDEPIIIAPGVGAGFLMIKREVFDVLGEIHGPPCPWFAEEIRDGIHMGEDLCFCLRAADAGFPTHVDRRVQVAHHKQARLGGRPLPVPTPA